LVGRTDRQICHVNMIFTRDNRTLFSYDFFISFVSHCLQNHKPSKALSMSNYMQKQRHYKQFYTNTSSISSCYISALVNKVESSLATKTHASRDHHMLRKLLTLSEKIWRQLSCRPPRLCCSGCWQEGLDKKNSRRWRKHVSCHELWVDEAEFWTIFSSTGCRTQFLSALKSLGANTVMLITLKYCKLIICWYDC